MLKLEQRLLAAVTIILAFLGIFFIFDVGTLKSMSLSGATDPYRLVKRQLLSFGVGLAAAGAAWWLDSKIYFRWKLPYVIYAAGLLLMALPLLLGSDARYGAQRWTSILGISVQLSEFAKVCLLIFFAHLVLQDNDWRLFVFYLAPAVALMLLQKDLGSLLIMLAGAGTIYYLSGVKLTTLLTLGVVGVAAVLVMILSSGYRRERLLTYLHPSDNTDSDAYHITQLQIAIGRGGLLGQGLGQSRQKFNFLPEVHTDSIFAIIAEETGFAGVTFILLLYAFFGYLQWRIVQFGALTPEQKMLGYGILATFVAQIFVNLAAISGLTPLTGITLPFLSFGGSSLVVSLLMVGIMLNLAGQKPPPARFTVKRRKYV